MAQSLTQDILLPIENIKSDVSAQNIERAVSKIEGVKDVKVEFNNQRAVVSTDSTESLHEVISTIQSLGYPVHTIKQNLHVLEMSCSACAVNTESMIKNSKGVLHAAVNFANSNLSVEYLPNMIDVFDMQKSLQNIGFDLLIEDEDKIQNILEDIQEKKYKKLKRNTFWALVFAMPVMVIGMVFMNMPYADYIMWVLSTPVLVWFGKDFFINAWKQAKNKSTNMDTLVALSTGIAYIFSVSIMIFPSFYQSRGISTHVYFEAAAVIIAFILLGRLLEEKAKNNTSTAIKKLMGLQPNEVTIIDESGLEKVIRIDDVQVDDIILVKPGDKIAVDGIITQGNSYVDESMLSGEPVPVLKDTGKEVFAGTINQKGSFRFRATKVGKETMLAHIIQMIQDAQGSKAPVQKLVDKIASIFVPTIIAIAILTFFAWWIFGGNTLLVKGMVAAITVLIIACPCALGLATPTAIMVGVGKGAENGILIKDAESLELAKNIDVVILDKTGTITEGNPQVNETVWLHQDDSLKNVLVSIEKHSEHPLAQAVIDYYQDATSVEIENFDSIVGQGVLGTYQNQQYWVGSPKLIREKNIEVAAELQKQASIWNEQAQTIIWFTDNQKAIAAIAISDQIKPTSKEAVQKLKNKNIDVHILTGDVEASARAVAQETGIQHFKAEVSPQEKAEYVKNLQEQGHVVAMVGDGINDSTALATADVSIAMGKGSDIAMDVAKMTIISSDLNKISDAITLSTQTTQTVKQNLFWAFFYNIIGVPIAAGILYPKYGFMLDPMIAGAAMAFSSVSVVSNSLRLKLKKM